MTFFFLNSLLTFGLRLLKWLYLTLDYFRKSRLVHQDRTQKNTKILNPKFVNPSEQKEFISFDILAISSLTRSVLSIRFRVTLKGKDKQTTNQ